MDYHHLSNITNYILKKNIDSCVHKKFEGAPSILYVPMFPMEIFLFYELRTEGRKSKESFLPSFLIYLLIMLENCVNFRVC
jgi:hypothetical protein